MECAADPTAVYLVDAWMAAFTVVASIGGIGLFIWLGFKLPVK